MEGGYIFMSPSPEGAFMWATTLFDSDPYFINEYKVPNSTPAIYNTGTYRLDNGKWTGGTGITDPIPVGDIPDVPDSGQIALLSDTMDYEYRQIAYFDGTNLISKDKNDAARVTISQKAGQLAAYVDRLDIIIYQLSQTIDDNAGVQHINSYLNMLSDLFNTMLQTIDSMTDVDGLTVDYADYIKSLESQLKATQKNELDVMLRLAARLTNDDTKDNDDILKDMAASCTVIKESTADIISAITTVDFLEPRNKSFFAKSLLQSPWY